MFTITYKLIDDSSYHIIEYDEKSINDKIMLIQDLNDEITYLDLRKSNIYEIDDEFDFPNLKKIYFSPKLKYIGGRFLEGNKKLKKLDLSSFPLTETPDVFLVHSNIEELYLPASIKYIERSFLTGSKKIKKLDLSHCTNLTMIGESFMGYCTNLEEIIFPPSLESIGNDCMNGCKKLKRLDLSNTCIDHFSNALESCPSLEELILPNTVESFYNIMWGCHNIKYCDFSNLTQLKNEYHDLFNCKSLKRVIFPIHAINFATYQDCEYAVVRINTLTQQNVLARVKTPNFKAIYCVKNNNVIYLVDYINYLNAMFLGIL